MHGDMEEGVLQIQPCTQSTLLEPLPDSLYVFHVEVDVPDLSIELFQVQDGPPFVRRSLRFWYREV